MPTPLTYSDNSYYADSNIYTLNTTDGTATVTGLVNGYSTTITIPSQVSYNSTSYTVTAIGAAAFQNASVTSVTLPDTLITIGYISFLECQLSSVHIPASVTSMGSAAFRSSTLSSITVDQANTHFAVQDDILYELFSDNTAIIRCATNVQGSSVYINSVTKNGVTYAVTGTYSDGASLMYLNKIHVIIGDNVTSIAEDAFINASGVQKVSFGFGMTAINCRFNEGCGSLNQVVIGGNVATIGPNVFANTNLTNVVIPKNVMSIGANAFAGYSGSVFFHGDYHPNLLMGAFSGAATAYHLSYSSGWSSIPSGFSAIDVLNQLTSDNYDAQGVRYVINDSNAYVTSYNGSIPNVYIPATVVLGNSSYNVTTINGGTFQNKNINAITVAEGITTIGGAVLYGTHISTFNIPASVTSIGDQVFNNNDNIKTITVTSGNTKFFTTNNDTRLYYINSSNDAELVWVAPFSTGTITVNSVAKGLTTYAVKKIWICAFHKTNFSFYTIGNNVIDANNAFEQNSDNAFSVTIGSGLTSTNCFSNWNSYNLTSLDLTRASSLRTIGGIKYTNLTSLTVPDFVTTIADMPRNGTLNTLTIGSGVITMDSWSCRNIGTVSIPNNAYFCADNSFIYKKDGISYKVNDFYKKLTAPNVVTVPSTITVGGNPINVVGINAFAFREATNISKLIISEGITQLNDPWLIYDNNIEKVSLPNSLTTIGNGVFQEGKISSIIIPANVTSIGDNAFNSCNQLTSVYFLGTKPTVGNNAFTSISNSATLHYPDGNTSWNNYTNNYFSSIKSISNVSANATTTANGLNKNYILASGSTLQVSENQSGIFNASGNATIKNSGTTTVVFSGSVIKDGTTLTLDAGNGEIQVTSQITGTSDNSDIIVKGNVTFSNASGNPYNGPTIINSGGSLTLNNSSLTNSDVTIKNGGTLIIIGSVSIKSLTMESHSTLNIVDATTFILSSLVTASTTLWRPEYNHCRR